MTPAILTLLEVWSRRPLREINYEDDADLVWNNEMLTAVKNAIPDLQTIDAIGAQRSLPDAGGVGEPKNGVTPPPNDQNAPTGILGANWTPRSQFPKLLDPTTLRQAAPMTTPSVDATPSSAELQGRLVERNIRILQEIRNTAGTGASSDQTPGIPDTSASVAAKLAAARKAAATTKPPSSRTPKPRATRKVRAVLP